MSISQRAYDMSRLKFVSSINQAMVRGQRYINKSANKYAKAMPQGQWSPIRKDDLPLDKVLALMNNK